MRKLKNWIDAYVEFTSFSEAPPKCHFWTGVSVIAGALRRKVWIDQAYFQWTPNFYIIFVAPPGIVAKSTTASIGMRLLKKIPEVHFGPSVVTWPSLVKKLSEVTETFTMGDTLESQEHFTMSALTISSSELGSFLDPKDKKMVDVLVDLWDGQLTDFEKETKTQGNDTVTNPWINIIACTTPAWIADNFPEYMIGGGFTARTIFVYAEEKHKYVAYPKYNVPEDFNRREAELIHDLEEIATQIKGEYILTKEAIEWGEAWYEKLYTNIPVHLNNKRFGTYIARKQTHMHKLAMVLAAAESNELIINPSHLKEAENQLKKIEVDMPKVFQKIGMTDITIMCSELMDMIKVEGKMSVTKAYKRFMERADAQDFELMLASISRTGEFELINASDTVYIKYKGA